MGGEDDKLIFRGFGDYQPLDCNPQQINLVFSFCILEDFKIYLFFTSVLKPTYFAIFFPIYLNLGQNPFCPLD